MKKRLFSLILALAILAGALPIASSAAPTVTKLDMPYKETYLPVDRRDGNGQYSTEKYSNYYYGSEDFEPALYTTLTAYCGSVESSVTNIKWKCETDFDISVCGDYIFYIDTYDGPYLPDSIIESSKVTVHVIDSLITKRSANFYLNGIPVRAKMVSASGMKFYDLTGGTVMPILNIAGMYINPATFTAANVVVFAGESSERCDKDAFLWVDSCTLKAIYCGGNTESAVYTGDAEILMTGSSSVSSVYGGGNNGGHDGDTLIKLTDNAAVTSVLCAGGAASAMSGKTTLSLSGSAMLSSVTKGNAESFEVNAAKDYDLLSFNVAESGAEMYRDGRKMTVIKSLSLGSAEYRADVGTAADKLSLPSSAEAVTDSGSITVSGIKWISDDYDPYTIGKYDFNIVLPEDYCLYANESAPVATVEVAVQSTVTVSRIELPIKETYISASVTSPVFYDSLNAYTTVDGHSVVFSLGGLSWTSSDFTPGKAGKYTFKIDTSKLSEHYVIPAYLIDSAKITVNVSDSHLKLADGAVSSPYPVSVTEAQGKYYRLSDLTGCNDLGVITGSDSKGTVIEHVKNLSSEYSLKADKVIVYGGQIKRIVTSDITAYGGTITDIIADTYINAVIKDGAVINGRIDLNGISSRSVISVPYRNVHNIKYPTDKAALVEINGDKMSDYSDAVKVSGTTVYCMGMPCYVKRDADGETYLYRSNDDSLFYDKPVTYYNIYGGSDGKKLKNTNIVMQSGLLSYISGGSDGGEITGCAVYIHNAGTIRFVARAGSNGSAKLARVHCEINDGYIGKAFVLSGNRCVVGTPDITDTTMTLIWNGGYSREVFLGNSSAMGEEDNCVYGTAVFEMNGGVINQLYGGMHKGITHSDFDITINEGIITQSIIQDGTGTSTGYTNIKVYGNFDDSLITVNDRNRLSLRHMKDKSYTYGFEPYVTDNSVYDTSSDSGKLTFRFLDMRLDSEPKETTYMPTKTGDATLITFPDGKLMLVDTGISDSGSVLVGTLKKLGVTKLDYLAVSHYHSDHTGGMSAIFNNFDVDTLLLPNLKASIDATYTSTASLFDKHPETKRVYLRAGDTLNIGGVRIDIYNPDTEYEEVPLYDTDAANNYSLLMKFTYGDDTALMTGDLYEAQEKILSEKYTAGELDSDLLKVMHHGGMTSCFYKFYEAISPTYAVVPNTQSRRVDNLCTKYLIDNYFNTPYYYALGENGIVKAVLTGSGIKVSAQYTYAFTDTDKGAWYGEYIDYVTTHSLMGGTGAMTFEPDSSLTRGMFATILARLDGSDISSYSNRFLDVKDGSWYAKAIAWANALGIAGGTGGGKFEPERSITRQEMAVMLYNYMQYRGISADVSNADYSGRQDIASWACDAVDFCSCVGILGGADGRFSPLSTATRAEAAAIFTRLDK